MAENGAVPQKPITEPVENPKYQNPLGFGILNVKIEGEKTLVSTQSYLHASEKAIEKNLTKKQN